MSGSKGRSAARQNVLVTTDYRNDHRRWSAACRKKLAIAALPACRSPVKLLIPSAQSRFLPASPPGRAKSAPSLLRSKPASIAGSPCPPPCRSPMHSGQRTAGSDADASRSAKARLRCGSSLSISLRFAATPRVHSAAPGPCSAREQHVCYSHCSPFYCYICHFIVKV